MEEDGAAGARTRHRCPAATRPLRAARLRRVGVGVGQGIRLAGDHHPVARVPARPGLLPDRRADGRPRRPRLVADQPLPTDERVAAVPGPGRGAHPVGALPEPRADASVAYVAGSIYVVGGRDAAGAPTTTVFMLSPDSQTGALGEWSAVDDLALPEARSESAAAITPDGLLLVGGRNADGPVATTLKTKLDDQGALGAWSQEQPLLTAQAGATAVLIGDYLWVYGGSDANGPVNRVQRGTFGLEAAEGLPANPDEGKLIRWDVNDRANLPAARANASGWGANGAIYLVGGNDGSGPKTEMYWAVPTTAGDVPEWKHLDASDLPTPLEGAPAVISGPDAIL